MIYQLVASTSPTPLCYTRPLNSHSFLSDRGGSLERETLEMDVVFVGAGPANLSGALHLARLVKEHNEAIESGKREGRAVGEIEIGEIEKGASVGGHNLLGSGMHARGVKELLLDC